MTRVFSDGAEYRDKLFWTSDAGGDITIVASGLPIGSWCYQCDYGEGWALKQFTPLVEGYWRTRNRFSGPGADSDYYKFPQIRNGSTEIARIAFNGSNYPALYIGGTEVANAGIALNASVWYLFECHLKIADSGGIFEVKMNGMPFMSYYGDTKYLTYSTFDGLLFCGSDGNVRGTNKQQHVDDFVLNDTNGDVDNSWPGNGFIEAYMPNAEGDLLEWTPTSGSHFENVDDVPHDTDTTYIQALTTTTKRDLLNIATFNETNRVVSRIWPEARMRDVNSGNVLVRLGVKTSGSIFTSGQKALSPSYTRVLGDELRINPMTGLVWTKTDLDALQLVLEADK